MSEYLNPPFPTLKNVIDGHIHMHKWYDENTNSLFLHAFEEYRKVCGLKYITLAPLPSGAPFPVARDVSNNIICAFYKLLNENTFLYGGFIYPSYPAKLEELKAHDMELEKQHDELMEIGFDGIKMLEGKPNLYNYIGNKLSAEIFDGAFSKMEKDNTYILMHARDPQVFWTEPTKERIEKNWYYGNGKYPTFEEFQAQIEAILEKHPRLNLCLAHFFFASGEPEVLENLFEKYENLCVDITPGGEMYIDFDKRPDFWHEFFKKHDSRIIFGTDMDFPVYLEAGRWLCDREYRFLATDETLKSFDDHTLTGIKLPNESVQKIFSSNLISKFGGKPKEINKQALKRYIEKYKHLISDKELAKYIDLLAEKYL